MALTVHTGKIGLYRGPNQLDITASNKNTDSLGKIFAPRWDDMVGPIIKARQNGCTPNEWEQLTNNYKRLYQEILDNVERTNILVVNHILGMNLVVLMCYCKQGQFCHRDLLAQWLVGKGAVASYKTKAIMSGDGWLQ